MILLKPLVREIVGIDFSPGMLEEAERRVEAAPGDARWRTVLGDAFAMEFDGAFDLAVCFGALGHVVVERQPAFLAQVHTVLRPGGRFVFLTSTMPPPWSRQWVASRGFNGAMHLRNAVIKPPFIMFYLNWTVPEVLPRLAAAGFESEVHDPGLEDHSRIRVVVATRCA
jgi:ubiquinone/menaquinone biosynthesis C-methylase UbiE